MYLTSIGLEVHVQLKTRSKMFCACSVEFGAAPNSHTCPICLGLPGALPVMNHEALRMTVLTGLMLGCEIPAISKFDRKNYFYPDVAKNYQITQYDQPLCANGRVPLHDLAYPKDAQKKIATADKQVALVRIHLEEDVAKSFHLENSSGIDFNRAGTPLMELVTQPEINSPEEASAFLTALKQMLIYAGVSDADMEKGQLRCDCNVSVRASAEQELGAKIEIKNMNSISGVRRALAYEIQRQSAALARGETLHQQTRGWNDEAGQTFVMRTKEFAHDYRYFPDPDLVPVKTQTLLEEARARLPELPQAKRTRFVQQYGISAYDAGILANDLELAGYFEAAAKDARKPKNIANWILNDLQNALAGSVRTIAVCPIPAEALDELVNLIDAGRISGKQGKEVFAEMFASGKSARAVVQEKGLEQLSDAATIEALCDQVIAANPKPAADFRAGHAAAMNFLKGQVMKLSRGKANPGVIGEILEKKLAI
ncbi:MAG: Asp-tRNA(Asn)/Glu-tRNA(Gln) amidotransferase subunit GatB [Verrucomicrobiota bacterium]|nr:Asp-tRNA(Asn)/Glu-tRNA(Gln) amidotransferase subunit GatB [Chthoniobacterales bacterium]MDQ3314807.1 Asp-tRNA(Asn)/Glu-tRNA(Gln) amidotransferase subunit GatB [Verrucomicrobiota bacterium]